MRHVAIIQGHPDPGGGHLCHALADAYAEGAIASGHGVTRIDVARLDIPPLRSKAEYEQAGLPPVLVPACDAMATSEHIVLVFPLWLGTMPAVVKAFLEQALRPGVAFAYQKGGLPAQLLAGRSAHMVVTMGMPAVAFRWFYGAHGVRGLERNILRFVGIKPVRTTYLGSVERADASRRAAWIERMRDDGRVLR